MVVVQMATGSPMERVAASAGRSQWAVALGWALLPLKHSRKHTLVAARLMQAAKEVRAEPMALAAVKMEAARAAVQEVEVVKEAVEAPPSLAGTAAMQALGATAAVMVTVAGAADVTRAATTLAEARQMAVSR